MVSLGAKEDAKPLNAIPHSGQSGRDWASDSRTGKAQVCTRSGVAWL